MPRIHRRKTIHTPPRRDKTTPSRRERTPADGPTDFALQRKMEVIGRGTFCDVADRRVLPEGGNEALARAEFASSSALALLYEQGKITSKAMRAGREYARLHRLLFGRSTPRQSGLSKVLATSLPERIAEATRAARDNEEMDDESYADWIAEQRILYERAEYRLRHIAGETHVSRRLIRTVVRAVAIDDLYPNKPGQIWRLRIGLTEIAEVFGFE